MIFIKKYIFIVLVGLLTIVILLIPKNIIPKEIKIEYEMINEKQTRYIYYLEDDIVVGVPFYNLDGNRYVLIEEVFKYLTEKSNAVAKEYHSELNLSSTLESYEIKGDDIYLEVSDNFFLIDNPLLALAQVLYTYKELDFKEVYIINNGLVIEQIENIVMYDGLVELPVNLDITSNTKKTKLIRITYYYKDGKKIFINHIVNSDEDEISFKINKILNFINKENKTNITLTNLIKKDNHLEIYLSCSENDIKIVKQILLKNLKISEKDIIITNVE